MPLVRAAWLRSKDIIKYLKASESRSQKAQAGEKDPETQTGVGENYKKKFKAAGPN